MAALGHEFEGLGEARKWKLLHRQRFEDAPPDRLHHLAPDQLEVGQIGADDNFLDLRGDSLLAAQVTSRLYAAFSVKLPLSSVFEHPTAAGLALRIEQMRRSVRELETAPSRALGEREVEHEL